MQALGSGYVGAISFTPSGGTVTSGTVGWDFEVADSVLETLAEGEAFNTRPQTYNIIISDGQGGSVTQQVAVTITGSKDAPTEDFTIAVTDVDDEAPTFTLGATSFDVDKNTTASITTLTATDLDSAVGDNSFSITGGADQSLFTIDPLTNGLAFNAPQNFEAPSDVGGDGTYEVTVRAEDGANNFTDQTLTVLL